MITRNEKTEDLGYSEFILRENVLSDDTLLLANEGKTFKGGYVAIIHYYTFQNAWMDKKNKIAFKTMESLDRYLSKNYPDFEFYA